MNEKHRVALVLDGAFDRWQTFATDIEAVAFAQGFCDGASHYGADSAWAVVWSREHQDLRKDNPDAFSDAAKALAALEIEEASS